MNKQSKVIKLTREEKEESFREAEASVFLEGYDLSKDSFFQGLKARLLAGEITSDEMGKIILDHHKTLAAERNK